MYAALYAPGNLPILLDCARQFSPLVEVTSGEMVTFDVRGLERIIGAVDQVAAAVMRAVGIPAQLTIASNPDTAGYLARSTPGASVVPNGQEAEYLFRLSLLYLGCPPEIGGILNAWGIHTFGQYAQLPPLGVAARLGEEGVYWQEQARGTCCRQLRVLQEAVRFYKEQEFEEAVTTLEPLLFLLGRFLVELCVELKARFLAAKEVNLRLALEDRNEHTISLRLPVPMQQHKALLKLVQLELEQRSPEAPICKLQIELLPAAPKTTQEEFFRAAYPFPEQLELTLARVRQIVGPEIVGSPELLDSYQPDGFVMRPFVSSARSASAPSPKPPALGFRRFRPPEPAQVKLEERPIFITSAIVRGPIQSARGPWFSSGHWWANDLWSREEWDVSFGNRTLFRIFRDLQAHAWFVEGNYD